MKRGNPKWVNQFAYDVTWKGKRRRVFIRRIRPCAVSDELIRLSDNPLKVFRWAVLR